MYTTKLCERLFIRSWTYTLKHSNSLQILINYFYILVIDFIFRYDDNIYHVNYASVFDWRKVFILIHCGSFLTIQIEFHGENVERKCDFTQWCQNMYSIVLIVIRHSKTLQFLTKYERTFEIFSCILVSSVTVNIPHCIFMLFSRFDGLE